MLKRAKYQNKCCFLFVRKARVNEKKEEEKNLIYLYEKSSKNTRWGF